jgi:anaerobic selenocysteine-containing dehydrogenase
LVGNVDNPGGVLIPRMTPLQTLPPFKKDAIARKGLNVERIDGGTNLPVLRHQPYLFAENVLSAKPYKPQVLFLYYTNPLFSNPSADLFSKAFSEIPLIVSFSPYLDDSTLYADLILPDHTPLERWQDDPLFLNSGFPVLGIRQPVIEPLYETKATGDVLLHMAKAFGGEIERAFPWNDFKEVLLYGIKGIFDAKRGDTFGLQFDQAWTRLLERGGWWAPSYKTFDEFWKLLQEKGGWWDPIYNFQEWDRIFQTPSKKFEFYAETLRQSHPFFTSGELRDSSLLPHWEETKGREDEKKYPFHLHTFRTMALTGSRNTNQPWLQASVGSYLFERWETWVEINPETAKQLEIADEDWVWVESPKGRIIARARLYKGAMPDVVNIPFGEGHQSGGRWAKGLGENPYRLLQDDRDPLTGYPMNGITRVRIYKA